jgi:hypothetical protein
VTWLPVWGNVSSGFIDQGRRVSINRVDSHFAETVGLRLIRGRRFEEGERDVAIVSESFARWHWPGEDPIGKRLANVDIGTVIGVAAKAGTFDVQDPDGLGIYSPILPADYRDASIVVRGASDPAKRTGQLIALSSAQDARLRPGYALMSAEYDATVARSRVLMSLLTGLGALATVLAAIGLAGLTGYTVSQRTREIGIRIALGARRTRVIRAVLRPLGIPVGVGIAGGMFAAVAISRVLRQQLASLRPADPFAYILAIAMFLVIVGLAISLPARRATRIQPADALRHD